MQPIRFLLTALACSLLASCAKPLLIVEASSRDLLLEIDAFVHDGEDLEIAYDFWSPDGIPFVSMRNLTDDTLFLDLRSSTYVLNANRIPFHDFIDRSQNFDIPLAEDRLVFMRIDRRPILALIPDRWASFYAPSCHNGRAVRRGEAFSFSYTYRKGTLEKKVRNRFNLAAIDRIARNEISTYERTEAGPNQYYIDQDFTRTQTASILFEILQLILFSM